MKCNISEVFGPTIQGEGIYTGEPSIFVRFNGCNLACAFGNSICDTPYTSHYKSEPEYTDTSKVVDYIVNNLGFVRHIVFTGGEPMLQQEAILAIIYKLENDHHIKMTYTVETNGTIGPMQELLNRIDLWSLSPKLPSSCQFPEDMKESLKNKHLKNRFNKDSFIEYIRSCKYQLKFVWSNEHSLDEIENWLGDVGLHSYDNILLMPAGSTQEELKQTQEGCVKTCIETGWRYCDRLHIRIWNNKKKV